MLYFLPLPSDSILLVFLKMRKWIEYRFSVGKVHSDKMDVLNQVKKFIKFLIPCKGEFSGRKFKVSNKSFEFPLSQWNVSLL